MDTRKFLTESLFRKMERDEDNNIFNNYNNFTRDEFVFEQTVKHCAWFFEEVLAALELSHKARNHFYQMYVKEKEKNDGIK